MIINGAEIERMPLFIYSSGNRGQTSLGDESGTVSRAPASTATFTGLAVNLLKVIEKSA